MSPLTIAHDVLGLVLKPDLSNTVTVHLTDQWIHALLGPLGDTVTEKTFSSNAVQYHRGSYKKPNSQLMIWL